MLTHHKVVGQPTWGASVKTLAMVDSARAAGTDAMIDQYPYTASYTGITILIPAWAMAGGTGDLLQRMEDPALADSILSGIEFNIINDRGGNDLRRVQFAIVRWDRSLEGKTLHDWAMREGLASTPETGARLVIEAVRRGGASAIFHAMSEEDVERIMAHPFTMIASDGRLTQPGEGHPHPRWYGTFPRVLGLYARDKGVISLEQAVRKMSTMPAERMGLRERGQLREGWFADVVIFDPATVADQATFEEPHQLATGVEHVLVAGVYFGIDSPLPCAALGPLPNRVAQRGNLTAGVLEVARRVQHRDVPAADDGQSHPVQSSPRSARPGFKPAPTFVSSSR